jgi:hypothetical protein
MTYCLLQLLLLSFLPEHLSFVAIALLPLNMENVVVVVEEEEQYEGHVPAWRTLLLKLILFLAPELEMVWRFSETLVQASSVAFAHLRQILEELAQASSCMLLTSGGSFWKD